MKLIDEKNQIYLDSSGNKYQRTDVVPAVKTGIKWGEFGRNLIVIGGISVLANLIVRINQMVKQNRLIRKTDSLKSGFGTKLQAFQDLYMAGVEAKSTPADRAKYRAVIHDLISDSIRLSLITATANETDRPTILSNYVKPFLATLRSILIKDICILTGEIALIDRRNFELVYAPGYTNESDVAKDSFRTILFKTKWPSHGFEVSTAAGGKDFNRLVADTVNYLAAHPQYLSIRVK